MITGSANGGLAYILTSVPQMPATSTLSSAASSATSGIGSSRSSVVPGPVRTAASTCSAMAPLLVAGPSVARTVAQGLLVGPCTSRSAGATAPDPSRGAPWPSPLLRTVTRTSGANAGAQGRHGRARGLRASPSRRCPVLVQAFRRMVRGLEFDVCEMALTTYLVAREHGVRVHRAARCSWSAASTTARSRCSPASDVREPADLEGRRVGVNRGYTVTTGVWARAVLAAGARRRPDGGDLGAVRRRARPGVPARRPTSCRRRPGARWRSCCAAASWPR